MEVRIEKAEKVQENKTDADLLGRNCTTSFPHKEYSDLWDGTHKTKFDLISSEAMLAHMCERSAQRASSIARD